MLYTIAIVAGCVELYAYAKKQLPNRYPLCILSGINQWAAFYEPIKKPDLGLPP
jgi:hypothetical protein